MISTPHSGYYYQDFLAELSSARETETYLEVGVQSGFNLSKIKANRAIGVDPEFNLAVDVTVNKKEVVLYRMTSDRFFRENRKKGDRTHSIDLAFLDGMHLFEFLLRDFYNTEEISTTSSIIA